jgi:hypothetical protein
LARRPYFASDSLACYIIDLFFSAYVSLSVSSKIIFSFSSAFMGGEDRPPFSFTPGTPNVERAEPPPEGA